MSHFEQHAVGTPSAATGHCIEEADSVIFGSLLRRSVEPLRAFGPRRVLSEAIFCIARHPLSQQVLSLEQSPPVDDVARRHPRQQVHRLIELVSIDIHQRCQIGHRDDPRPSQAIYHLVEDDLARRLPPTVQLLDGLDYRLHRLEADLVTVHDTALRGLVRVGGVVGGVAAAVAAVACSAVVFVGALDCSIANTVRTALAAAVRAAVAAAVRAALAALVRAAVFCGFCGFI